MKLVPEHVFLLGQLWPTARCMVARSAIILPSLGWPVCAAANEVFQTVPSEQSQLRRPRSGRAGMRVFPVAGDSDKCHLHSVLDAVYQVYMDANARDEFWM